MKRIPECEAQPGECYATNVTGSINVVRACLAGGVMRCIGISTDKACRAVTAYGASKLAMEKLFQAQPAGGCIFTLVRYGNVVASNGSVIPIWRDKAARGEALPITDKRCTRFWMAPSEAVDLIELAATQESGITVVPKMRSIELAVMADWIAPGAELVETGLRSCEKIHEDLVHLDELALDYGPWGFKLGHGGVTGFCYTSETSLGLTRPNVAPMLSRDQFLAMLAEAESYD
jgi:UDP-N-acetylglucosamine 4,6-dehydratase